MGNVVAFRGRAVPATPVVSVEAKKEGAQKEPLSPDRKRALERQLLLMSEFLEGFPPSKTETLRIRSQALAECGDEELLDILEESRQAQWQQHPTYYRALEAILGGRKLLGGFGAVITAVASMLEDGTFKLTEIT